jgi:hypothetical protein
MVLVQKLEALQKQVLQFIQAFQVLKREIERLEQENKEMREREKP